MTNESAGAGSKPSSTKTTVTRTYTYAAIEMAEMTTALVFYKAFLEALGKRAGDGLVDLVRKRVKIKDARDEYRIGIDDASGATIAITADTPDEARLALLDLDVMADELRGKTLRWDSGSSSWRPDPDD